MTKPEPKFDIGEQVEIPHLRTVGTIDDRRYSESNGDWIYTIYKVGGDRNLSIYQERNLIST